MKRATIGAAVSAVTLLTLYGTGRDNIGASDERRSTTDSSSVETPAGNPPHAGVTTPDGVTLIAPLVFVCRGQEHPTSIVPTVAVNCPERS